ncbi:hypothetical protein F2Q69_00062190 [Brassica cretica]|uniref:Sm domain-containing protein n=1 Tax=Brassica cretica TaxID=69181 RepID=A0A8S9RN01_BRACR|nr:hypothetical protein F2Q69_00062190 [Brassica cretica]
MLISSNPSVADPLLSSSNSGVDLSRSLQAYYIEFFITNWFLFYYTGILACLDGYMNIAMGQTEEYVNGQLKNKYGDAFIRVLCISTVNRPLADGA